MATTAETAVDSSGTDCVSSMKAPVVGEGAPGSVSSEQTSSRVSDDHEKPPVSSVDAGEDGSRLAFLLSVLGMEESVSSAEGGSSVSTATGVEVPDCPLAVGRKSSALSETSKGEAESANLRSGDREHRVCRATKSEGGGSVHARSGFSWNRKSGTGGSKKGTPGFEEPRNVASNRHFDGVLGGNGAAASAGSGKKPSVEVLRGWGTAEFAKAGADRRNGRGSGTGAQNQNSQKRGQDDQRRAELPNTASLTGTPGHPGSGCLPNLLLNDSALALQTALVALLQLQKQGQDGVQKKPVIPRRNLMCTSFLRTGVCNNAERCNYAHNMEELQKKLELRKTSLCKYWLKGRCENEDCNFAHGENELQSTEGVYKTTICKYWKQGACYSGSSCRHAHGEADLRPEKLPPHLERKRNQSAKSVAKIGGGAPPPSVVLGGTKAQAFHHGSSKGEGVAFKKDEAGFGGQALEDYAGRQAAMSDWWRSSTIESNRYSKGVETVLHTGQTGVNGCGGDQLDSMRQVERQRRPYGNERDIGFDLLSPGLECVLRGPSTVVRPMRYESLSAGGTWSHIGAGGRASDEASDLSTISATSAGLADSFRGYGRENSGGSDTLLGGSTAATITRDGSLTDDESRLNAGWRALTTSSNNSDSAAVHARGNSGGLTFVPPPGLYVQNDVGPAMTPYGSAPSSAREVEPKASGGFYPYISEQVLKTLSESVAALSVEEFTNERTSVSNATSKSEDVPASVDIEARGGDSRKRTGLVTSTTRSSTSLHAEAEACGGGGSNATEGLRSGRASSVVSNTSQQHLEALALVVSLIADGSADNPDVSAALQ